MEDFLLTLIKKIHLLLRRTQIAIDISDFEESKYTMTLKNSKHLPIFPLTPQSTVLTIYTMFVKAHTNAICLLSVLCVLYCSEESTMDFPN
jgi:hypothetical protein